MGAMWKREEEEEEKDWGGGRGGSVSDILWGIYIENSDRNALFLVINDSTDEALVGVWDANKTAPSPRRVCTPYSHLNNNTANETAPISKAYMCPCRQHRQQKCTLSKRHLCTP